jgi:hypothetical protein
MPSGWLRPSRRIAAPQSSSSCPKADSATRAPAGYFDGKVAHLGEPLIKLGVLVEHVLQGLPQILFRAREHVFQADAQQIFRRNLKVDGFLAQLLHPVFGHGNRDIGHVRLRYQVYLSRDKTTRVAGHGELANEAV